jgi:hypothetical protein
VRRSFEPDTYEPAAGTGWDEARMRFATLSAETADLEVSA